MQAQNTTNSKPTRQDLLDAWAAYEAAWTAAEAGGWEYDLSRDEIEAKWIEQLREEGYRLLNQRKPIFRIQRIY